jgi:hypothetical protein
MKNSQSSALTLVRALQQSATPAQVDDIFEQQLQKMPAGEQIVFHGYMKRFADELLQMPPEEVKQIETVEEAHANLDKRWAKVPAFLRSVLTQGFAMACSSQIQSEQKYLRILLHVHAHEGAGASPRLQAFVGAAAKLEPKEMQDPLLTARLRLSAFKATR